MVGLDDDPSRAQIVLVGALAIAFIILGIVVVFNTSLYAENVDSTGTVSSVNQAEQVRHAGGDSIAGVAYRVNDGTYPNKESGIGAAVENNASNLSAVWQVLNAQSNPVVTNISFNETEQATDYGVRVYSTGNESFEGNSIGANNWSLTEDTEQTQFANATLTIMGPTTLSDSEEDSFRIAILGQSGSGYRWRVLRFTYNRSGNENLTIQNGTESDGSDPGTTFGVNTPAATEPCDIDVDDEFVVDLSNGSVQGSSMTCSFAFTDGIEPIGGEGYELRFMNPDNVSGRYSMLFSNEDTVTGRSNPPFTVAGNPGDAPYYSYIVWAAGVDIEYGSTTVSSDRTVTVPVYNSTR